MKYQDTVQFDNGYGVSSVFNTNPGKEDMCSVDYPYQALITINGEHHFRTPLSSGCVGWLDYRGLESLKYRVANLPPTVKKVVALAEERGFRLASHHDWQEFRAALLNSGHKWAHPTRGMWKEVMQA